MSYLQTGRDTTIYDGQFTNAHTINNSIFYPQPANSTNHGEPLHPYQILEANIALEALYDSDARFDPPKCHPQTRTAILDHVDRWSKDAESPPVLWIRGGAGAGKSAIAQTLSERWDEDGSLAATFHFSREATGRNEKRRLVSTLAYQLSVTFPDTRRLIENSIRADPKIFSRNLRAQMKKLVIEPLLSVTTRVQLTPKVIVIDGLDECCVDYLNQTHEQQQQEILECIQWTIDQRGIPLRFFIASRPERQIRDIFEHGLLKSMSIRIVLDNSHNPAADIELYLRCKLEEIRCIHSHLGSSWPPEGVVAQLVTKSSGHFVYAAVVVRYLSSPRMDPAVGLENVMNVSPIWNTDSPFAELDALYMHILRSVALESLPIIMDVFRLMVHGAIYDEGEPLDYPLFHGIKRMSPTFVAKYIFVPLGKLYVDLTDLHSILDIPLQASSCTVPISFLHASFSEFLTQSPRSEQFHIDRDDSELRILSLSIRHLFTQALLPESGKEDKYTDNGFAFRVGMGLWYTKPDKNILLALKAFIDQDETEFTQHVHQTNLDTLGTSRNSLEVIQELYRSITAERPTVLQVLKMHGICDFVPITPEIVSKTRPYTGVLDWFRDPEQVAHNPYVGALRLAGGSGTFHVPFNHNLTLAHPKESITQESSNIEFFPTLGTLDDSHPGLEEQGELRSQDLSQPRNSPLSTRWYSKNLSIARRGAPPSFSRHVAGLGLRLQSHVSLMSSSRGESPRPTCCDNFSEVPD